MSCVVMYVGYQNYSKCIGFSDEEKEQLKSKGIKKVELVGYGSSDYVPLTNGPVRVDDLKSRKSDPVVEESDSGAFLFIILAVIIICIIIYLCFSGKSRYRSKRY